MLEKVCQRIGMEYFPGKEEFWHKKHHHFFGSAGTAKQVSKGDSKVGLQRDFAPEFNQAWEDYNRQLGEDTRLQAVVDRLRALDIDALCRHRGRSPGRGSGHVRGVCGRPGIIVTR